MKLSILASALFAVLLSVVSVDAQTKTYISVMNAAQTASSCPTSIAIGNAVLTLTGTKLCMRLAYGKLSATETSSTLSSGAIGVAGTTIKALSSKPQKLDCITLTSAQVSDIALGKYYVQINTAACPKGEIRGQILLVDL